MVSNQKVQGFAIIKQSVLQSVYHWDANFHSLGIISNNNKNTFSLDSEI